MVEGDIVFIPKDARLPYAYNDECLQYARKRELPMTVISYDECMEHHGFLPEGLHHEKTVPVKWLCLNPEYMMDTDTSPSFHYWVIHRKYLQYLNHSEAMEEIW